MGFEIEVLLQHGGSDLLFEMRCIFVAVGLNYSKIKEIERYFQVCEELISRIHGFRFMFFVMSVIRDEIEVY